MKQHLTRNCSSKQCAVIAATLALLFLAAVNVSQAQTFTTLHNFTGGADGDSPFAGLSMDRAGNLYGTTAYGGHVGGACTQYANCGTVFELKRKGSDWIFYTLYEFRGPDGETPEARVIVGPDGNLYGTTMAGGQSGQGTVFRLQPPPSFCKAFTCPWTEAVLHSFKGGSDGANPAYGDLAFDQAGNIYGTTPNGGANASGTVFELSPSGSTWTETIIHAFNGSDGYEPYAGVIFDNAGNLYGTTSGGEGGSGNAFEMTHTSSGWSLNVIYNFPFPGGAYGGLIRDAAGNLYGITAFNPTVYELSPSNGSWTYKELYTLGGYFTTSQLTMDAAGNLYGTIVLSNTEVFRLTPSGGQWTMTGFSGSAGAEPYGNVIFDASGNLYATASEDCVFEITP